MEAEVQFQYAEVLPPFWRFVVFFPPMKVWVWFCHLHCLGWSLPDRSGRCHVGSVLPKREVYSQVSHVQTPQQQRVRVIGTLTERLTERTHIPTSWKGASQEPFLYIFFPPKILLCLLRLYFNMLWKKWLFTPWRTAVSAIDCVQSWDDICKALIYDWQYIWY